jgi:hypothetical protein
MEIIDEEIIRQLTGEFACIITLIIIGVFIIKYISINKNNGKNNSNI